MSRQRQHARHLAHTHNKTASRRSTQSHTTRHVRHRQRHTEHTITHEERTYSIVCELTSSLDTTPRALVSLCQHGNHQFIVDSRLFSRRISPSSIAPHFRQTLCTTDTRRRYVTASSTRCHRRRTRFAVALQSSTCALRVAPSMFARASATR